MAFFSSLDREITNFLLNLNQQQTNKFEFIITRPIDMDNGFLGLIGGVIDNGIDVTLSKLYVQSIEFPPGISFTYDRRNDKQFVVGLEYPANCTISFIEDEFGTVRRYLKLWERDVCEPVRSQDLASKLGAANAGASQFFGGTRPNPTSVPEGVVFQDRQDLAKRNGMLFLGGTGSLFGTTVVPTYPRMMLYGLGYQSLASLTISQSGNEALLYTLTCSIDNISIPILF